MNIFLSSEIIKNKDLSDRAFLVYVLLRSALIKDKEIYCLTETILHYIAHNKLPSTFYETKIIEGGIMDLSDIGLIKIIEKRNVHYILDLSEIYIDENEPFVIIKQQELNTICTYSYNQRYKLLRYFVLLLSTFRKRGGFFIGCTPIIQLSNDFKTSTKTIVKYNDLLEELNLVYVCRNDDVIVCEDNTIKSITNTYGRYKDKDAIIAANDNYRKKYGFKQKQTDRINANETRSASQKYNQMLKGKEYPYDEAKKIYLILFEYNERMNHFDKQKMKDLSIFKKYDFFYT